MIRFENVCIQFNNKCLLKNLNFTIKKGDKLLLYGKSGIGKTTIFRFILCFEPLKEGAIHFENQPVDDRAVWEIRKKTAYVSQDLDIGSGPVKILIDKAFSFKATVHLKPSKERLNELLSFLDLEEGILNEAYEKLSGGEKQRIAIIIAILLQRKIFFLDEATSSLDAELKLKVIKYFLEKKDWTVLSISHDKDWLNNPGLKVIRLKG